MPDNHNKIRFQPTCLPVGTSFASSAVAVAVAPVAAASFFVAAARTTAAVGPVPVAAVLVLAEVTSAAHFAAVLQRTGPRHIVVLAADTAP